jgi:Ca-activated chloride channel family protein
LLCMDARVEPDSPARTFLGGPMLDAKGARLRLIAALCLLSACSPSDGSQKSADNGPANDNYGQLLIGYKDGHVGAKGAPTGDSSSHGSNGAAATDPAIGGDIGAGDGDSAPLGDGDGDFGGSFDAGVAPIGDAGPAVDAGHDAAHDAGPAHPPEDAGSKDGAIFDNGSGDGGGFQDASVGFPFEDPPDASSSDDISPNGDAGPENPGPAGKVLENPFFSTDKEPTSTFGLDGDTGAYTLARGAINAGKLPRPELVRIEEFLNYFHFHYAQPQGDVPFSLYTELADCPWNSQRKLIMLGVQGQEVKLEDQPAANLVFLIDVSGSMDDPSKLPLLKKAFRMLANQTRAQDRVSIVTYAGNEQIVLVGAHGDEHERIVKAIDDLESGGSTNGAGGIQAAYDLAQQQFIKGGNNRVLLATDGDFNVGISTTDELVDFIAQKRDSGVFLSTYGVGSSWDDGNYRDDVLEQLADKGNGIYFFIDGPEEARRAFLSTVSGSLLTVAKDVKLQVEFSPEQVKGYRLIGYENRVIANQDFNNDHVDGGELGAGLTMTALYEIIPAGSSEAIPADLAMTAPVITPETQPDDGTQQAALIEPRSAPLGHNLFQLRVRYKGRDATQSELIQQNYDTSIQRDTPSPKFGFAAAVSEFAIQLRGSQYASARPVSALYPAIERAAPLDGEGAIAEFRALVEKADALRKAP